MLCKLQRSRKPVTTSLIRIPKGMFSWPMRLRRQTKKKPGISFDYLLGELADVPEYKGKTSVEVQHMARDLWVKKPTS